MFSTRSGAAKLSIAVVITLIGLKIAVAVLTGSLSILAQAVDSSLDLIAVIITFIAVRLAVKPADEEHPFGHGKSENIAAIAQGILVFGAGIAIIYSAVQRIITGAVLEFTDAGIGVMAFSIIASLLLSRHLFRVAGKEDSAALEANAHNIAVDVYSAAAVLVGLLVIRFTGLSILDPVLALLVSLLILKVAYGILRKSVGQLMDTRLPVAEEEIIRLSLKAHGNEMVNFHHLRTRKSGNQRLIELHMVVPCDASVEEAHRLTDHLEHDIKAKLFPSQVTIHVEPCDGNCDDCPLPPDRCRDRKDL